MLVFDTDLVLVFAALVLLLSAICFKTDVFLLLLELEDFLVLVDFLELDFDELLPLDSDLDAVTVCCT